MVEEFDLSHSDLSFLKQLEKYTFDSKMCCCQIYASRIMTSSEVSMQLMQEQNFMPWELEAFAAFSVVYDDPAATEEITGDVFSSTITLLRNFWHPELTLAEKNGVYADYFMMISTMQQFPTHGLFLQKMFRYDFFFNFCNDKVDMCEEFVQVFGERYRAFEAFAFGVFVSCSIESQRQIGQKDCAIALSKTLAISSVRKQLSISKDVCCKGWLSRPLLLQR